MWNDDNYIGGFSPEPTNNITEQPVSPITEETENTLQIQADNSTITPEQPSTPVITQQETPVIHEEKKIYSSYHINESIPTPSLPEEEKKTTKDKKQKNKRSLVFAGKALVAGLIFGIVAFSTVYGLSKAFPIETKTTTIEKVSISNTQTTTPVSSTNIETGSYNISQVTQEVMPAVVSINCTATVVYNSFFGQEEYQSNSAGTGFIIGNNDTELLIATNNHVIAGAEAIQIVFCDGTTADALLKGSGNDIDLAVVSVKWEDLSEDTKANIKIAALGDSDTLIVGEPSIAIGNSLGYGQSVTSGIISALDREVTVTTDDSYGYGNFQEITSLLIQTDAAINPGNSGGPLLNSKGEVIGINSVKYSSEEVEGMGYAIPINDALPILEDLMNRKTKEKVDEDKQSYIGITGSDVTSDAATIYGMPNGVFVAQVIEDGPAEKCGIKRGDIISELDGTSISSMEDLTEELLYHEAGSTVEIVVNRNKDGEYEEITLEIKLGAKKDMPSDEELTEE